MQTCLQTKRQGQRGHVGQMNDDSNANSTQCFRFQKAMIMLYGRFII